MRANEFIKKFGIEHAKYLLEDTTLEYFAIWSQCAGKSFQDTVCVKDLKRYIDAYELVRFIGGINSAKAHIVEVIRDYDDAVTNDWKIYDHDIKIGDIKQAITLVEECQ